MYLEYIICKRQGHGSCVHVSVTVYMVAYALLVFIFTIYNEISPPCSYLCKQLQFVIKFTRKPKLAKNSKDLHRIQTWGPA